MCWGPTEEWIQGKVVGALQTGGPSTRASLKLRYLRLLKCLFRIQLQALRGVGGVSLSGCFLVPLSSFLKPLFVRLRLLCGSDMQLFPLEFLHFYSNFIPNAYLKSRKLKIVGFTIAMDDEGV